MKLKLFSRLIFPFLLFLISNYAWAGTQSNSKNPDTQISVIAEASKGFTTIGEPVECRFLIRHGKKIEILSTIADPEAPGLDIKPLKDWTDKEGKLLVEGRSFSLTAFQLGNYMVAPLEVSYREQGGPVLKTQTNSLYLTVKSVKEGEEKTDIRDVKGVVPLPYQLVKYLVPSGIALLIGALAAFYFLYYRKHIQPRLQAVERHTPEELAIQQLTELFDSTLIRDGKVKQYYLRFSEILKVFLEKQFGILATEATTSEIARLMKRVDAPDNTKKLLIEVLESADFAKFARWVPPPSEIITLNKKAEQTVHELAAPAIPAEKVDHDVS